MKPFLYIANWKMQVPFNKVSSLVDEYITLVELLEKKSAQLIICPSFPALYPIQTIIKDHHTLALGAQNCSRHSQGAFTGQVAAQSLAEIGCTYCIVGHSESRIYNHETDSVVAQKAVELFKNGITPLFCVGETKQDRADGKAMYAVEEQLQPLFKRMHKEYETKQLVIAYEPVWSIGTGVIPSEEQVTQMFTFIMDTCKKNIPDVPITMLYGGSINGQTVQNFYKIKEMHGFLIGGASLDIQTLKKIVSYS